MSTKRTEDYHDFGVQQGQKTWKMINIFQLPLM